MEAFEEMRRQAADVPEMSLDEINEEIRAARAVRKGGRLMRCYAVVDTNVFVSALLSKKEDAATVQMLRAMLSGRFTPLYHEDIPAECEEVLHRPKFHLSESVICTVVSAVKRYGIEVFPQPTGEILAAAGPGIRRRAGQAGLP